MELEVQKYLRSGKSLKNLKLEHGVNSFICRDKIGFSYDQLEAKENDVLSQQCRGLILREKIFDIVACPIFRFFNLEQDYCKANIDWDSAVYEEKLDGTLIIAYFDSNLNKWCVGTRSCPEADKAIDGGAFTFTTLFEYALEKLNKNGIQEFFKYANTYNTYCFELTTPVNRIICDYKDFNIHLLAVRSNLSLKEEETTKYNKLFNLNKITTYSFNNIDSLIKIIHAWDPKEHEGVVIKDKNFNRIKVKSPAYCAFNHLVHDKLKTSVRGCLELILLEKDDDVMSMWPQFIAERVVTLKEAVKQTFIQTNEDFEKYKHLEIKEFALATQNCIWPSALICLKRNKIKTLKEMIIKENEINAAKSKLDHLFSVLLKTNPDIIKYES